MNKQSLQTALLITGLIMVSGCLGKHEIAEKKDTPTAGKQNEKVVTTEKKAPTAPKDLVYDETTKKLSWEASEDPDAAEGDVLTYYVYIKAQKAADIEKDVSKYNIASATSYSFKTDKTEVELDWSLYKDSDGSYIKNLVAVVLVVDKDGNRALSESTKDDDLDPPAGTTTADATPPTAPTDVKFEATTLKLSWSASTDETTTDPKKIKYYVFVSQGSAEPDSSKLTNAITHTEGTTEVVFAASDLAKILVVKTNDPVESAVKVHVIAVDEADNKSQPGKLSGTIPATQLVAPATTYNDGDEDIDGTET